MRTLRLRQAVVAAADCDAVVAAWTTELALGAPFHDPGVAEFGLRNAVLAVSDAFLEVVSPLTAGTSSAAGRHMARNGGDCGYMAIFQVADMDDARNHLGALGVRTVWSADLADIRGTHVHPADVGAAIVSLDQATPPESWRWAGPDWTRRVQTTVVDGLAGVVLQSPDPQALLARWSTVLDLPANDEAITLPDRSYVAVRDAGAGGRVGLVGIDLWAAAGVQPRSFSVAGVNFGIVPRTA